MNDEALFFYRKNVKNMFDMIWWFESEENKVYCNGKIKLASWNKKEHRIIKKIPAVTIVAAWIRAETGVSPSMASGNHVCKPIWADLPIAPKNKKKQIVFISKLLNLSDNKKTVEKSTEPVVLKIKKIAIANAVSPIRLTITALIAALLACILVNLKLISKYEQRPTPSQPVNSWIKLLLVTKTIIKKVNKDKYAKNRCKCESFFCFEWLTMHRYIHRQCLC